MHRSYLGSPILESSLVPHTMGKMCSPVPNGSTAVRETPSARSAEPHLCLLPGRSQGNCFLTHSFTSPWYLAYREGKQVTTPEVPCMLGELHSFTYPTRYLNREHHPSVPKSSVYIPQELNCNVLKRFCGRDTENTLGRRKLCKARHWIPLGGPSPL